MEKTFNGVYLSRRREINAQHKQTHRVESNVVSLVYSEKGKKVTLFLKKNSNYFQIIFYNIDIVLVTNEEKSPFFSPSLT
ncbi:hypothetical protein FHS86_001523 [Roseimarinus sediminis]|jgi:hypothetical protein